MEPIKQKKNLTNCCLYYKLHFMTNKTAVQNESPGRRAAAYWFEDGLPELLAGLMLLVFFLVMLAAYLRWINPVLFIVLWSAGFTFIFTLPAWGWKVLDFIKTRLTYPRSGYATPPGDPGPGQDFFYDLLGKRKSETILTLRTAPPPKTNVTNFGFRIIIILAIMGFFSPLCTKGWAVALITLAMAAMLYLITRRDAHAYTWISVLPVALAGLMAAFWDLPPDIRKFIPLLIVSGWLVVRGAWLLVRFLHKHPRPGELNGGCV